MLLVSNYVCIVFQCKLNKSCVNSWGNKHVNLYKADLAHYQCLPQHKNRNAESKVKNIIRDDIDYEDSEDIANLFNNYFVVIGKSIAESVEGGTYIIISIT